jgi:hypothetical protein
LNTDFKEQKNIINYSLSVTEPLEEEIIKWKKSVIALPLPYNYTLPIVDVNESYLDIISSDPNLNFEGNINTWYTDGIYKKYYPRLAEEGILILHPYNVTMPRFLSQNITLYNYSYVLLARVAHIGNLAKYNSSECFKLYGCVDAEIKIKVTDIETKREETIYDGIIDSRDGWKDIKIDISKYKGKNITFKIEGWAGGPCDVWCGEWAAVDKFYIGKTRGELKVNETIIEKIIENLRNLGYLK